MGVRAGGARPGRYAPLQCYITISYKIEILKPIFYIIV